MKQKILNRTRSFPRNWKLLLLLLVGFCGFGFQSNASHFRYHTVSWSMGTNDTVIFQVTQSWRWSAFGNPALNTVTPISSFTFGDATSTSYSLLITSINPTEDWFTGVTTIKHKYPANGTYIFQYSDCCRIGGLLDGNSGLSQLMQTSVTIGGSPQNNSPVTTVPAIVNFQLNSPNTFTIPGYDPDGDALTFSITPTANSGLNTSTPPGLTLSSAGVINWTPTVSGLSAFSVKITDSKGDYTTVDFLLRSSVFTSNPPTFDYAVTPVNNFVYSVNPGTPINFNVKADDVDAGSTVVLTGSGIPSGATFTPGLPTTAANPATTAFSWTPGMADIGSYVMALTATDNNGQQAITNIIINVNTNPVFDVPPTPVAGSGFCVVVGDTLNETIQAQNLLSGVNVSITSVAGLPAGAVHTPSLPTTPATYAITNLSWAPTSADWGPHTATYTALDANNKSATHSFNVLVNSSPSITSVAAPGTATVGILYSHTFTGTDPDVPFGDVLSWVQTGMPAWLTLVDNGNGTATLSGTPGPGDLGTHTFDATLEDTYHHCGPHVEETVTINVLPCNTSNSSTASACGSYLWAVDGNTYTTTGTYTYASTNPVTGCVHTEILDLTITPSTSNTTTISVCDTYTWSVDGNTYTSTGTYTSVSGCHTEILDLTITPSTSNTTTISACDSYTWSLNNINYTQSGTYSVVTGCHTELLDLTITTLSLTTSSTDVTCNGAQDGTGTVSWANSNNGSFGFENGLTDWQSIGLAAVETNIGGVLPTHGSNMGIISTQGGQDSTTIENFLGLSAGSISSIATDVVTVGSAFKRNITVSAGQTVTFYYNFMTQDYLPFNDLAFLSITGNSIQLLANVSMATNLNSLGNNIYGVEHQTNWNSYSYTFTNAGTYSVGFGIMNLIDGGVPSLLAVDGGTSASVSWSTTPVQTTNTATGLAPGTYTVTVTDGPCTSTATVTINEPAAITGSESQTACGSYTWPANGTTYSNSGIYTAVVPAANGCDSTVTLNLTINPAPVVMAYDVSACASGAVTLLGTPAGGTFSLPNPYNGPTTSYTYTYTDGNGCTSTSAPAMAFHSNAVPITGISSSNIGANTATINWNGVPGLLWYEVRYRLLGSASWTGGGTQAAPTTSKTITGLDAASIYEIEVRGFCVQNQPGPWSTTHVFQTGLACPAPQNLFETNVTLNAVKLNWSAVPGVNYYQIRYRTSAGPGAWVSGGTAPSSAISKVITGLSANTAYDWQIRAICNPAPFSTGTWSALGDFMTLASKPGDVEEAVSTIDYAVTVYPNPTSENLSIELAAQQTQVTIVKLYDLSGRLVKQMQTQIEAGTQTITMNVSELSSGLYTIQVYANDQMVHTSKVNKQN